MFLKTTYADLRASFTAVPPDLAHCGRRLTQLKLNTDDLVIARAILEIGAFWNIRTQDLVSFDDTFYNNLTTLPPSRHEYPIRGLQLVHLLMQKLIADFHTALEGLHDTAMKSPYIIYAKVWATCAQVPAPEYSNFVDSLMGVTRNEIARCQEAAYESLTLRTPQHCCSSLHSPSYSPLHVRCMLLIYEIVLTDGAHWQPTFQMNKIIAASLLFGARAEQIV
ncbi:hypothetical protein B0H14DRAFT_3086173 [Mycena olivaceomarginata]|nr:hypothetical protein B0H14DRAFT_3086173 [Mycena olivaceomarginata]